MAATENTGRKEILMCPLPRGLVCLFFQGVFCIDIYILDSNISIYFCVHIYVCIHTQIEVKKGLKKPYAYPMLNCVSAISTFVL